MTWFFKTLEKKVYSKAKKPIQEITVDELISWKTKNKKSIKWDIHYWVRLWLDTECFISWILYELLVYFRVFNSIFKKYYYIILFKFMIYIDKIENLKSKGHSPRLSIVTMELFLKKIYRNIGLLSIGPMGWIVEYWAAPIILVQWVHCHYKLVGSLRIEIYIISVLRALWRNQSSSKNYLWMKIYSVNEQNMYYNSTINLCGLFIELIIVILLTDDIV